MELLFQLGRSQLQKDVFPLVKQEVKCPRPVPNVTVKPPRHNLVTGWICAYLRL